MAREFACRIADSEVNIASARCADSAARILVECEAGERVDISHIAYLAGEICCEKRQSAAWEDGFIGGDASVGDDRLIQAAVRPALFCLPEKYEARVNLSVLTDKRRVGLEIIYKGCQADAVRRDFSFADKLLDDTFIFVAVVGGVAVSYEPTIRHTNHSRTLNVGDIDLEGVVEPDDFTAGEHIGIFNFRRAGYGVIWPLAPFLPRIWPFSPLTRSSG